MVSSLLTSRRGPGHNVDEVLHEGKTTARVRRLTGQPATALLTFNGAHDDGVEMPPPTVVARWMEHLAARGFRAVRTSALSPSAADVLRASGFVEVQTLSLLDLATDAAHCSRPPADLGVRRIRRRIGPQRLASLAAVDKAAFGPTWALGVAELADALEATHRASLFVAGRDRPEGFAVAGVTDRTGYLQRLSVVPERQRVGIGSALLSTAVAWMRGQGCERVLVNTESTNAAALALYAKFGFRALDVSLVVMERHLDPRPSGETR